MSAAALGTLMPGMPGALIHDLDPLRLESSELLRDQFNGAHRIYAGMIFLNGLTVNLA